MEPSRDDYMRSVTIGERRRVDGPIYLADYDPKVREAAGRAYQAVAKTAPPAASPRVRYPDQPTAIALARMPTRATLIIAGVGALEIELKPSEAPVTVARFVTLARAGYYNGLTFHRIAPNFVIQGGSPGANEYAGADRYMRDELGGEPHLRGSVGISTRGRDTGDAQIFIDLVDLPRLDHDYTVFGRVTSGLDLLEKILEGARIERITIK
jgi:cyclophilin family peptidyl-prolyl cis-trans isomerase